MRHKENALVIATTVGEFEAALCAGSSLKCNLRIFIGQNADLDSFCVTNRCFYKDRYDKEFIVKKGKLRNFFFEILYGKLMGLYIFVPLNFFDERHPMILRLFYYFLSTFVIRDSLFPHQKPSKYHHYRIIPRLIVENNINSTVYRSFRNVHLSGPSKFLSIIRKTLQQPIETNNKIAVLTKNIPADGTDKLETYYRVLKNLSSKHIIDFKIHSRDTLSKKILLNNQLNIIEKNIYEISQEYKYIVIFGGSSGELSVYRDNIFYVSDTLFNRSKKHFENSTNVYSPEELQEVLSHLK